MNYCHIWWYLDFRVECNELKRLTSLCTLVRPLISATIIPTMPPLKVAAREKNFLFEVMSWYHESGYLRFASHVKTSCYSAIQPRKLDDVNMKRRNGLITAQCSLHK